MYLSDKNLLKVIDHLKESGEITFKTEAYTVMGLDTTRVHKIRFPEKYATKQAYHFSAEHIRLFCDYFKINSNYIYGFESNMYRK